MAKKKPEVLSGVEAPAVMEKDPGGAKEKAAAAHPAADPTMGRIVQYKSRDGISRPAIVLRAVDGLTELHVFGVGSGMIVKAKEGKEVLQWSWPAKV